MFSLPLAAHGSSPLARGLRDYEGMRPALVRIIPARAGFTPPRRVATGTPRDHPRSRGVYFIFRSLFLCACGSSPLARGLHLQRLHPLRRAGIIPARAGFTPNHRGCGEGLRDHPRSRGVYPTRGPWARATGGSSPLARGLHNRTCDDDAADGIIPARAGFTRPRRLQRPEVTDHPRSRGVYTPATT